MCIRDRYYLNPKCSDPRYCNPKYFSPLRRVPLCMYPSLIKRQPDSSLRLLILIRVLYAGHHLGASRRPLAAIGCVWCLCLASVCTSIAVARAVSVTCTPSVGFRQRIMFNKTKMPRSSHIEFAYTCTPVASAWHDVSPFGGIT